MKIKRAGRQMIITCECGYQIGFKDGPYAISTLFEEYELMKLDHEQPKKRRIWTWKKKK